MCILFCSSSIAQDLDHIHISEFMAANESTLADMDGDFTDWIELYNPTDATIHLEGYAIYHVLKVLPKAHNLQQVLF